MEDAVADLFRPQSRKAMSECDRLWVNMMRYRDALDIVERQMLATQRSLERARSTFRNSMVSAATAVLSLLGHAIGAVSRLLRALRTLRRALRGGKFSRKDLEAVLLTLTGLGAAITAVQNIRQSFRSYDLIDDLSEDLHASAQAAHDLRRRIQDAATRLDRACATNRHVA